MRRVRLLTMIAFIGSLLLVGPALADKRVALVIGNSTYRSAGLLANPVRDADLVGAALHKAGVDDVTIVHDLDRTGMVNALKSLATKADDADWAIIYYAGHGMEIDGINYLIPVDAGLVRDRDVPNETIPLESLMSALDGAHALKLVVLDACRNNPFLRQMKLSGARRALERGLSRVEPTGATLVVYAAKEGTTAEDGDLDNSPFARSFAARIAEPGVEINKTLRFVRDDVLSATGQRQEPFVYGSLPPQDFFFVPGLVPAKPNVDPRLAEAAVIWPSLASSSDVATLEAFKQRYAGTAYETFADLRLATLHEQPTVSAAKPAPQQKLAFLPSQAGIGFGLQLFTINDEDRARTMLQAMTRKFPSFFRDRPITFKTVQSNSLGTFYRGRVGPWASRAEAEAFCARLKTAGADCLVTPW
jgi:hypothetical protein